MAAHKHPQFYRQLGREPGQIVANALEVLARRFSLRLIPVKTLIGVCRPVVGSTCAILRRGVPAVGAANGLLKQLRKSPDAKANHIEQKTDPNENEDRPLYCFEPRMKVAEFAEADCSRMDFANAINPERV
jgi:hypothetical protein